MGLTKINIIAWPGLPGTMKTRCHKVPPQNGGLHRRPCGPGNKGKIADLPDMVERELKIKQQNSQTSAITKLPLPPNSNQQGNKYNSKGNLESKPSQVLPRCWCHTTLKGLSQWQQLRTCSTNFSATLWPPGHSCCCTEVFPHFRERQGEAAPRAPKMAAPTPPVSASACRQVFVKFAL